MSRFWQDTKIDLEELRALEMCREPDPWTPEIQLMYALDQAKADEAAALLRAINCLDHSGVDHIFNMLVYDAEYPRHEFWYPYRLSLEPRRPKNSIKGAHQAVGNPITTSPIVFTDERYIHALHEGKHEDAAKVLSGCNTLGKQALDLMANMLDDYGGQDKLPPDACPFGFRLRRWRSNGRPRQTIYDTRNQARGREVSRFVAAGMSRKDAIAEVAHRTGKLGKESAIGKAYDKHRRRKTG